MKFASFTNLESGTARDWSSSSDTFTYSELRELQGVEFLSIIHSLLVQATPLGYALLVR